MPGTLSLDPFVANGYSLLEMTEAINRLPYNIYSRTLELGLFQEEPITLTVVSVEERGGTLNLLPSIVRGAPHLVNRSAKRKLKTFAVPQIVLDDVVLPSEVAGVRAFGTGNQVDTVASKVTQKLREMRNKHDITKEWMRIGALKGILLDGDGSTTLYNFFTEFGMTPFVQDFQFTSGTLDVNQAVLNVKRHMEDNLHGDMMTGVRALCAPNFFDALVGHANVQKAFLYFMTTQPLGYDYRKGFNYGGVTFEEYRGTATDPTGTAHKFIPDGTCQFFPEGTNSTFRMYNAPADYNETVNTPGLPYYAKQDERKFQEGWDLTTQSNPFPICLRPELLVQGTMS
jgi:hypothetical protein